MRASASVVVAMKSRRFDGVKVFAATIADGRARLGETVMGWLSARPSVEVVDVVVRQSSDARFHCLTIVLFYAEQPAR
jgi:hypothetical protein